jgi:hypothetical protein
MKPEKVKTLLVEVAKFLAVGKYLVMPHAREREKDRKILRSEVIGILNSGYHEKSKDQYDKTYQAWNYAIRGYTVDRRELRVIVSIDNDRGLLIITVINLKDERVS